MISQSDYELAVNALENAPEEEALRGVVTRILSMYGLRHFVYHAVSLPDDSMPTPKLVLSYPQDWIEHYTGRDYFSIDPVVAAGTMAVLPVDWSRLDRRGHQTRKLFGEANEFGVGKQGITFPVRGAFGDHALFSITSDADKATWERCRLMYMRDFQMIAHLFHGRVLAFRVASGTKLPSLLSPRERECLQWAARGKTNKGIARELKISERVVRAYFETARHKLNCLNRSHVVSRAMSLQLIQSTAP